MKKIYNIIKLFLESKKQYFVKTFTEDYSEDPAGFKSSSVNAPLSKRQYIIWAALFLSGVFLTVFRSTHEAVWYDESYTIAAIGNSFGEMVKMIGRDSHPPLYFLGLKLFTICFGNSLFVLRLFSALAIIFMGSLGFTHIRKLWSQKAALIYTLLCYTMPVSIFQAQEIRMYSWCGAFVAWATILLYQAWQSGKLSHWIYGSLFAYAAALTHYYGLIAVTVTYGIMFFYSFFKKKYLIRIIVTSVLLIIAYMPFFYMLIYQATRVSKGFWIWDRSLWEVMTLFTYFFGYKSPHLNGGVVLFAALGSGVLIIFALLHAWRTKDKGSELFFAAILVFFLTLLAVFVLSELFQPIVMGRYITAILGPFLLILTYALCVIPDLKKFIQTLFLYLLFILPTLYGIYFHFFNGPMNYVTAHMTHRVKPGDIFIHGSEHNFGTFSYYFPDNFHYLYYSDKHNPYSNYEVFQKRGDYGPGSKYLRYLDNKKDIWITNRPGDHTRFHLKKIAAHKNYIQASKTKKWFLDKSWYGVEITRFVYTEDKSSYVNTVSGDLRITVSGVQSNNGGPVNILWALFNCDPIEEENTYLYGNADVSNGKAFIKIEDLDYDTYFIFAWQDQNSNGKPDLETEPTAVANGKYSEDILFKNNSFVFSSEQKNFNIELLDQ